MGKGGLSKSPNPRATDAQYKNPESLKLFWLTRFLDALKKARSSSLSPITSPSMGRLREVKDEEHLYLPGLSTYRSIVPCDFRT